MSCGTNYVYFERVCVGALFIWNLRPFWALRALSLHAAHGHALSLSGSWMHGAISIFMGAGR